METAGPYYGKALKRAPVVITLTHAIPGDATGGCAGRIIGVEKLVNGFVCICICVHVCVRTQRTAACLDRNSSSGDSICDSIIGVFLIRVKHFILPVTPSRPRQSDRHAVAVVEHRTVSPKGGANTLAEESRARHRGPIGKGFRAMVSIIFGSSGMSDDPLFPGARAEDSFRASVSHAGKKKKRSTNEHA